jgi:hypothetical protein
MLTVIACSTVISPETTASAQGPFSGVQRSNGAFFDTRTGDIYEHASDGSFGSHWRLIKLGQPLLRER